nr:LOW QUALITY PROTEIN: putative C-type lectin domain family 20 member A [Loxodonta africana]
MQEGHKDRVRGKELVEQRDGGVRQLREWVGLASSSRPVEQLAGRPEGRARCNFRAGGEVQSRRGGWRGPALAKSSLGTREWGGGYVVTASPAPAWKLVSSSNKTFFGVEKLLNLYKALWHCQVHHTDLADLQNLNSLGAIMSIYSTLSYADMWVGLYLNVNINGLSWSSGSTFTLPVWSLLPVMHQYVFCCHPFTGDRLVDGTEALHLLLWCVESYSGPGLPPRERPSFAGANERKREREALRLSEDN